jgi:hypothetical protein
MGINPCKQQFTVNSVAFSDQISTRLNIKKRRERINYRTLSNRDNINIAYVTNKPVIPTNNLFISDKSTSLVQNRLSVDQNITISTTKTISSSVEKLLITDVFSSDEPTQPQTPLFYFHKLRYFNSDLNNFDDLTLLSLRFADYDMCSVETYHSQIDTTYYLDSTNGHLYNNIENTYNSTDSSFNVIFVNYTVKNNDNGSINVYHELINNEQVYSQAEVDDLEYYDTAIQVKAGTKRYITELQPGLGLYLITLPTVQRYAYKQALGSRLKVLPPIAINLLSPWYVRVTNGLVIASLNTSGSTYSNFKYYLAEYNSQTFDPHPPYRYVHQQPAVWIYNNLIYVPKNISLGTEHNLNIDIIISDRDKVVKYAYTTDENKIGDGYSGSIVYSDGILSIDGLNGFIELANTVLDDDIIKVSYYTVEDEYEFSFINLNPSNNLDILNQRLVLYINPETANTGVLSQSLHYLLVNSLGKIIYASQAASNGADAVTLKMLNEDFDSDGAPLYDFYYDIESTTTGLNTEVPGSSYSERSQFSFLDKYTLNSVLITTPSLVDTSETTSNFENNSRLLVLADIYVGEGSSTEQASIFDTRVNGGGIKEEYLDEAIIENSEVLQYWDCNRNITYPSVGAFLVEVPQTLLSAHGGRFTRNQIVDITSRHMKAGGYAILRTYGIDPAITTIVTTSGTCEVRWPSYGSGITYNIYYSQGLKTGFSQANDTTVSDVSDGNTYTISGLTALTKYYVKVGALDTNSDESFGTTVSATTTSVISS